MSFIQIKLFHQHLSFLVNLNIDGIAKRNRMVECYNNLIKQNNEYLKIIREKNKQ